MLIHHIIIFKIGSFSELVFISHLKLSTVLIEMNTYLLPFQGWMNEVHDYDPETYHPALTHSVYATLEGSCLRLDSPRNNISRRATYDERVHEAAFVKSRSFQLAKSKVR